MIRAEQVLPLGGPRQRALLGLLLLHANEPISRERLIDELWADTPPTTVNAVLNVYLSRLRRLLADATGEPLLVNQAAGYALKVRAETIDARRFETLLEQGRRELAGGEPERAASTLRSALAMWYGPPLADLALEPFAQTEIARLEELRLSALENRIEADLALGRQDALVAELETLVAVHPYREGLRAQLMLALYRSGRQAEALETYRQARTMFSEELGIEPGSRLRELEGAILRHDSSLEADARDRRIRGRRPMLSLSRRTVLAMAAALAFVAAIVLATVGRDTSDRPTAPVKLVGQSVAVVDPTNNAIVAEIPVGGRPTGIAAGAGAVWVGNRDDNTLLRIDARSRRVVRTIGLGRQPTRVAVDAERVWVLGDRSLLLIDPDLNDVIATVRLPQVGSLNFRWDFLEVGPQAVWVCSCNTTHGALARVDPDTRTIVLVRDVPVGVIAYGEGALWALTGFELDTIERVDPATNAVVRRISTRNIGETVGGYPRLLVAGAGAVWSASARALWRIDPATNRFAGGVELAHTPQSLAVGARALWVATNDGLLLRIDPVAQKVAATVPLGAVIRPVVGDDAVAVGDDTVWVAVTSLAS